MSIGDLITRRFELKTEKDRINKQLKAVDDEIREVEYQLLEAMDKADLPSAANSIGRVTISEQTVYNPTDWDQIYTYIADTNQPFLLQRRLMNNAIAELARQGVNVPGTEPVNLRKLSFRKV